MISIFKCIFQVRLGIFSVMLTAISEYLEKCHSKLFDW